MESLDGSNHRVRAVSTLQNRRPCGWHRGQSCRLRDGCLRYFVSIYCGLFEHYVRIFVTRLFHVGRCPACDANTVAMISSPVSVDWCVFKRFHSCRIIESACDMHTLPIPPMFASRIGVCSFNLRVKTERSRVPQTLRSIAGRCLARPIGCLVLLS